MSTDEVIAMSIMFFLIVVLFCLVIWLTGRISDLNRGFEASKWNNGRRHQDIRDRVGSVETTLAEAVTLLGELQEQVAELESTPTTKKPLPFVKSEPFTPNADSIS